MTSITTLARFDASEIFPLIGSGMPPIVLNGYSIKVASNRLECLKRNPKCVSCSRIGTTFLLQSHTGELPHLNLFAFTGEREPQTWKSMWKKMMTKDHIIPKCMGGSDEIHNLQTMCSECNHKKGGITLGQPLQHPQLPPKKKKKITEKKKEFLKIDGCSIHSTWGINYETS